MNSDPQQWNDPEQSARDGARRAPRVTGLARLPWAWLATLIGLFGAIAIMLSPNQPLVLITVGWVCALLAIVIGGISAWKQAATRSRAISAVVIGVATLALILVVGTYALG